MRFRPADRRQVVTALQEFAAQAGLSEAVIHAADLSLEEHITNIIHYGYDHVEGHAITVRFALREGALVVEVEDDGKPFNPVDRPEVDITLNMEKKPIGGLGIHLMRRFMDELSYRHENNHNILTMRKRLSPS